MLKKKTPTLFGGLQEFLEKYSQFGYGAVWHSITEALCGGKVFTGFHIPSADTGNEVFFYDRELLARFVSMSKPAQEIFLWAVRNAMRTEEVDAIALTAKWSEFEDRTIYIWRASSDGSLNIRF